MEEGKHAEELVTRGSTRVCSPHGGRDRLLPPAAPPPFPAQVSPSSSSPTRSCTALSPHPQVRGRGVSGEPRFQFRGRDSPRFKLSSSRSWGPWGSRGSRDVMHYLKLEMSQRPAGQRSSWDQLEHKGARMHWPPRRGQKARSGFPAGDVREDAGFSHWRPGVSIPRSPIPHPTEPTCSGSGDRALMETVRPPGGEAAGTALWSGL